MRMRAGKFGTLSLGIALVTGLGLFELNAQADIPPGPELLEAESALSMNFETPHTKWAKPYAQGKTRVLFFGPWYQGGTECREMVELMERFDLEADAVYCFPPGNRLVGDGDPRWYQDPELATKRLLRLLETPCDVIFMNQVPVGNLNDTAKAAVLAAVEQGTGLVYVGKDEPWGAENFTLLEDKPTRVGAMEAYRYGNGRVVHLALRKELEFGFGWETLFDNQMAKQGLALLWAARREPRGTIQIAIENHGAAPSGQGASDPINVAQATGDLTGQMELSWADAPSGSSISVDLRDATGARQRIITVDASVPGRVPLRIPAVPSGTYFIDAFLRSESGIENWLSSKYVSEAERPLDPIELTKDWAEPGERIEGSATLSSVRDGDTMRVRLYDVNNRILAEQSGPMAAGGKTPFAFDVPEWYPMLVRVEAVHSNGGMDLAASNAYVRVTQRKRGQFHFVMWNVHTKELAPYGALSLAKYGVTSVLQNTPLMCLSAANLPFVPYASSFRASSHSLLAALDNDGILKSGCVHDEEGMSKFVAETVERARKAREMGVFVYSLGDENAVRAGCLSPSCKKAYQDYLRDEVYDTIGALNASWGTNFASFDEVDVEREGDLPAADAPKWFKDFYTQRLIKNQTDDDVKDPKQIIVGDINDEMRALQGENYARWYDRQDFQNWSYVQWCKRFVKGFKELDPQALTGFEGTDSFSIRKLTTRSRQGGDLDLFMRDTEYFGPYGGPANEVVRSLAKGDFPRGNWIGYSMDPDKELGYYWDQITNGFNAIQWWRLDNIGQGYHGYLGPDMTPTPTSRPLIEDTQIVRDGLGDLLMRYTMDGDGIAMLYSLPSTYIAHFDGNPSYGLYVRDHEHWIDAIHNAGLQFDYVTDRQLRLGEFDASKYKVLILPLAFAIGDQEAEVIRAFVAGGGTLVADVRPGTYNDRCKPRDQGVLDDVFGIKRTGKQDAVDLDRVSIHAPLGDTNVDIEWGNWHGHDVYPQMVADPDVELATGEALGWNFPIHFTHGLKYPAGIVNGHGKGRAILFNFSVYNAPLDGFLKQVLEASGVREAVKVRAEVGLDFRGRQVALRNDGEEEDVAAAAEGRDESGVYPKGLEVTRWHNGDVQLIALLGDADRNVAVTLPEARYVYDIKTKESPGQTREFTASLRKARASFYALLPNEAQPPQVTLQPAGAGPGTVVTAKITTPGGNAARAVKLRLIDPAGEQADWLVDHTVTQDGRGSATIPFALNDPEGSWTLAAEDVLTGTENTYSIELR